MTKKKPPTPKPPDPPDKVHIPEVVDRDANGKFLKGHRVPTGYNPLSRAGLVKRHHIITNTPIEHVMQVMDAMRKQATNGNAHAAGLWMAYAVGAPEKFIEKDDAQSMDALGDRRAIEDMTNDQKLQKMALMEIELRELEKIAAPEGKPK